MDHRLSKALKSGLRSLLRRPRLAAPLRARLGGAGVILLLHEIHDDLARELMTGCPPSLLTIVVNSLRRDGWDIVCLDEAVRRVAHWGGATPAYGAGGPRTPVRRFDLRRRLSRYAEPRPADSRAAEDALHGLRADRRGNARALRMVAGAGRPVSGGAGGMCR